MSAPTTRRFARTLAEAFPDERACAIERHARRFDPSPWVGVLCLLALGGMAFAGWLA